MSKKYSEQRYENGVDHMVGMPPGTDLRQALGLPIHTAPMGANGGNTVATGTVTSKQHGQTVFPSGVTEDPIEKQVPTFDLSSKTGMGIQDKGTFANNMSADVPILTPLLGYADKAADMVHVPRTEGWTLFWYGFFLTAVFLTAFKVIPAALGWTVSHWPRGFTTPALGTGA